MNCSYFEWIKRQRLGLKSCVRKNERERCTSFHLTYYVHHFIVLWSGMGWNEWGMKLYIYILSNMYWPSIFLFKFNNQSVKTQKCNISLVLYQWYVLFSCYFYDTIKSHEPFRINPSPLPASSWVGDLGDDFSESLQSSWYLL
jgi:hypothetical protein